MKQTLEPFLLDLEERIVPAVEEDLLAAWRQFCDGACPDPIFSPRRGKASPSNMEWPRIWINDALEDADLMVLRELCACSDALARGSGEVLNVRANYGTGILSSLLGVTAFRMERELDTLPTNYPLEGGKDAVVRALDRGLPAVRQGLMAKALDLGDYVQEVIKPYPRIQRFVHLYHPDLQGPIDNVELLWGSGVFLDLVDNPELVAAFLGLVTDTYIACMRAWQACVPPQGDCAAHWGLLHRGAVMLREDSLMNLSPQIYRILIQPHDQRILDTFGGGAVHFCGRGTHFIGDVAGLRGLTAVNLSQPELNDMEKIFAATVDRGVNLLGLKSEFGQAALARGRALHGRVHCP